MAGQQGLLVGEQVSLVDQPLPLHAVEALERARHHLDADMPPICATQDLSSSARDRVGPGRLAPPLMSTTRTSSASSACVMLCLILSISCSLTCPCSGSAGAAVSVEPGPCTCTGSQAVPCPKPMLRQKQP